jgi:hypothetical protein
VFGKQDAKSENYAKLVIYIWKQLLWYWETESITEILYVILCFELHSFYAYIISSYHYSCGMKLLIPFLSIICEILKRIQKHKAKTFLLQWPCLQFVTIQRVNLTIFSCTCGSMFLESFQLCMYDLHCICIKWY